MTKTNLLKSTFIIPVMFDSQDRLKNAYVTLPYLFNHFNTNIIIYEQGRKSVVAQILEQIDTSGSNIDVLFNETISDTFHRTAYLNKMLAMVKTPVVVNYDIDILLQPQVYVTCEKKILGGIDMLYPYFLGMSQVSVNNQGRERLYAGLPLERLTKDDSAFSPSEFGHCQFFNTESYRQGGAENELFVSYAPEDVERYYRFEKLGYRVEHENANVYHLEHSRGVNSSTANPNTRRNNLLFEKIKEMSTEELRQYYGINNQFLRQEKRV